MTNEEAINGLKSLKEPCEDAISRADAKKYLSAPDVKGDRVIYESDLDLLPPVTPQPKMGHWIMKHRSHNELKHYTGQDEMGETHTISVLERYEIDEPYCSECGKLAGDTSQNFCCACGAKMQEVGMKERWIIEAERKIIEAEQNAKDLAERICEQIAEEADYLYVDREWYFGKVVQYMRRESEILR